MLIIKQPVQIDEDNVDHGYALTTDEYNIILYKLGIYIKGKNQGEISKTPVGYFSTLEHVLQRIKDLEVRLRGLDDLDGLVERIRAVMDEVSNNLKSVKITKGDVLK
ncbi:TPA: hypothetical protein PNO69_004494 [Salmonella enterica]|nr:hypothetical protein [Salmonella enterica]HCH9607937.1 hypothetical protein [Salmonella enterica]HDI5000231.1 hypothetical protein [Salmonella enterica]HDI5005052.1 hypothetical protein [Salmonella enterica]